MTFVRKYSAWLAAPFATAAVPFFIALSTSGIAAADTGSAAKQLLQALQSPSPAPTVSTATTTNTSPGITVPIGVSLASIGTNNAIIPQAAATTTTTATTSNSSLLQSLLSELHSLEAQIAALEGSATPTAVLQPSAGTGFVFTRNLSLNDSGPDVLALQQFLNAHGSLVAATGPGSQGEETSHFGPATYHALVKYQSESGLPATGYFGPQTRAFIAEHSASQPNSQLNNTASSTTSSASSTISTPTTSSLIPVTNFPGFGGGGSSGSGGGSSSPTPSVSLTAPSSGAAVGGAVTLTATASESGGAIQSVQFKVDGSNIGSAIASSPYTTTWNSTTTTDGSHTLYAVAKDAGGNYATSSESVTLSNPPYDVVLVVGDSYGGTVLPRDVATDLAWPGMYQYGSYSADASTYQKIVATVPLADFGENTWTAGSNGNPLSYAEYVAKSYAARTGRKVLLVPIIVGGSSIAEPGSRWPVGQSNHEAAVSQANLAIAAAVAQYPNSRFAGIIQWMGANDAEYSGMTTAAWKTAEVAAIADFRSRITGASNSWYVLSGLMPEFLATNPTLTNQVEYAMQEIAGEGASILYVPMQSGYNNGDNLHPNQAGIRLMGGLVDAALADITAPVLISASGAATGATVANLSVSTNEGNGRLFYVVTTSSVAPSVAQFIAGQDSTGAAAPFSGAQEVSATGSQTAAATGLTASTTYYAWFMQKDGSGNASTPVSNSFTTQAAPTTSPLTITYNGAFGWTADNVAGPYTQTINYMTPATTSRMLIVAVGAWAYTNDITAITLNGTSIAPHQIYQRDTGGQTAVWLYTVAIPTGTSGALSITFGGGADAPIVGVWEMTGASSTTPSVINSAPGDGVGGNDTVHLSNVVPVNGGFIAAALNGNYPNGWNTPTPTDATKTITGTSTISQMLSLTHENIPAGGSTAITISSPNTGTSAGLMASWAPIGN